MDKQLLDYEDDILSTVSEKYHRPCVYVLLNPASGLTKIGYTDNFNRRYREITNNIGTRPELICMCLTEEAKALEQQLHDKFSTYRQEGEWFQLPSHVLEVLKRGVH